MQILTKIKAKLKANKAKLTTSLTVMSLMITTCMSCFAEGEVTSAVSSGLSIFSEVSSTLLSNPIFLCILGAGLVPLGFKIFKSGKKAVK